MTSLPTNPESALVKRIRTQMIIIGLLTIIILAGLFYYFFDRARFTEQRPKTVLFREAVDDGIAEDGIDNFKDMARYSALYFSDGVLFDSAAISDYLKYDYPGIIARHTEQQRQSGVSLPPHCTWKIGFYWKYGNGPNDKVGLSYYVVPVIYDSVTNKGTVLDYFSSSNRKYYNRQKDDNDPENIHDEGHLWP